MIKHNYNVHGKYLEKVHIIADRNCGPFIADNVGKILSSCDIIERC